MTHSESPPEAPAQVAIFSTLPPPYGGVTVHVARLLGHLRASGMPIRVYENLGKNDPARGIYPARKSMVGFLTFLLTVRELVIHLHTNSLSAMMLGSLILRMRGRRVILTLHSEKPMRTLKRLPAWLCGLGLALLRPADSIVCVNANLHTWLLAEQFPPDKLRLCPAYIPPSPDECDDRHLTQEMRDFLAAHQQVIASHGSFGYFIDGVHVYSFDMLAAMLKNLRQKFPNLGMVTTISGNYAETYRQQILALRQELGLAEHWLISEKPFPAVSLFKKCQIFVRPTITDGDSVSIRECQMLGVPVVASDAVPRPPTTILFHNRDQADFEHRVCEILRATPAAASMGDSRASEQPLPEGVAVAREIYRKALAGMTPAVGKPG
jgi:glycosyltransferase involved in cell wall biosynthesis